MSATVSIFTKNFENSIEEGIIKVGIPSADVLTGNSVPIDIISSPGANKAIFVEEAVFFINTYGGTPYATNTTLDIVYDTSLTSINQFTSRLATAGTGIFLPSDRSYMGVHGSPTAIETNKKVQLYVPVGNPTAGNSIVNVWIKYRVLNLS